MVSWFQSLASSPTCGSSIFLAQYPYNGIVSTLLLPGDMVLKWSYSNPLLLNCILNIQPRISLSKTPWIAPVSDFFLVAVISLKQLDSSCLTSPNPVAAQRKNTPPPLQSTLGASSSFYVGFYIEGFPFPIELRSPILPCNTKEPTFAGLCFDNAFSRCSRLHLWRGWKWGCLFFSSLSPRGGVGGYVTEGGSFLKS